MVTTANYSFGYHYAAAYWSAYYNGTVAHRLANAYSYLCAGFFGNTKAACHYYNYH
jgi:hypothetical protein